VKGLKRVEVINTQLRLFMLKSRALFEIEQSKRKEIII
jgi:hypothetical protein